MEGVHESGRTKSVGVARGLAAGVALAATLVLSIGAPVSAAPPANDDRGNATVVGGLPFDDAIDTSEATPQGSDPECFSGEGNPTVWYSFTPSTDGTFGASTSGSSYDTTLLVATPDNGGLDVIDCNDDSLGVTSAVTWNGQAGTTYLIMVGACCGQPGGDMELRLRRDPKLPRVGVSVSERGEATPGGAARISGRVTCRRTNDLAIVAARVKQLSARYIVRGVGRTQAGCGRAWRTKARNRTLRFLEGTAIVRATATACNLFGCTSTTTRQKVRLR